MSMRRTGHARRRQALRPPSVDQAPDGVLDLDRVLEWNGATLRAPLGFVPEPGDLMNVRFGNHEWEPAPVSDVGMPYRVSLDLIIPHLGKVVPAAYAIQRGTALYPSDVLFLAIPTFQADDPRLTAASFVQAYGTVLSFQAFQGDPTIVVSPWPFMAAGQRIWLTVVIEDAGGNVSRLPVLAGDPVGEEFVDEGFEVSVSRQALEDMVTGEGNEARLELLVSFDGSPSLTDAVPFPTATYRVTRDPVTIRTDFERDPLQKFITGRTLVLESGIAITKRYGLTGMDGIEVARRDQPPYVESHVMTVHLGSEVLIDPPNPVSHVELALAAPLDAPTRFEFFDAAGQSVHVIERAAPEPVWVTYDAPAPFSRILVSTRVAGFSPKVEIDNLSFTT